MTKKTDDRPAPRFRVSDLNAMLDLALSQMGEEGMAAAAVAITSIGGRYSPRNRMIMFVQRPEVRTVAGIHEWRRRGRKVRKGEKGIAFLAPVKRKPTSQADHGEQGQDSAPGDTAPDTGEKVRKVSGVCVRYVFDLAQTDPLGGCDDCGSEPGKECDPFCPAGLGTTEWPDAYSLEFDAEDVAALVEEIQEQAEQAATRRPGPTETGAEAAEPEQGLTLHA